jgi:hypothetical protein
MVVGVGSCKIKLDSNYPTVLKVKCAKFHQNWSKTVDLHTKQTNQPTNRHSVLYTGLFPSANEPDGIENATHNTFS